MTNEYLYNSIQQNNLYEWNEKELQIKKTTLRNVLGKLVVWDISNYDRESENVVSLCRENG